MNYHDFMRTVIRFTNRRTAPDALTGDTFRVQLIAAVRRARPGLHAALIALLDTNPHRTPDQIHDFLERNWTRMTPPAPPTSS